MLGIMGNVMYMYVKKIMLERLLDLELWPKMFRLGVVGKGRQIFIISHQLLFSMQGSILTLQIPAIIPVWCTSSKHYISQGLSVRQMPPVTKVKT